MFVLQHNTIKTSVVCSLQLERGHIPVFN